MRILNWAIRRLFAWPAVLVGLVFTLLGVLCTRFACWALDYNPEELLAPPTK